MPQDALENSYGDKRHYCAVYDRGAKWFCETHNVEWTKFRETPLVCKFTVWRMMGIPK